MQFFHTSFALLQIDYEIKWSIKAKGHAFSSGGRACDLCLTEKLVILTSDQNSTLNKRDELLEICNVVFLKEKIRYIMITIHKMHLALEWLQSNIFQLSVLD
jgi:hypothetical protein